ncbi:hypothetical protein B296_00017229 [Ensete ventricosum]|uniref:Uncharacterized protein n=1 Tax=Ensete ventricosum TaxID=4639 RepID=A0A426ZPY6_ENSVE|nr:hypothetical protein B296_00017229 [Ensete ventricosum]
MGICTSTVSQKNITVINFVQSRVSISFSCTDSEIQNSSNSHVLVHGKSYEHDFMKKHDGQKLWAKSSFNRFFVCHLEKFKILAIPNVLALRKSYEHSFTKKRDGYIFCTMSRAKSSFDQFFIHHLRNSKYYPFPTY